MNQESNHMKNEKNISNEIIIKIEHINDYKML